MFSLVYFCIVKRAEIYNKMEKAINYLRLAEYSEVNLDVLARLVEMSPDHFQKTFTAWAGVSPKKFHQLISLENAKKILRENKGSNLQVSLELGLSSVSRLHDLFVGIERMSPGEYKNGASGMKLKYSFLDTRFGHLLVAETERGICYAQFQDDCLDTDSLRQQYPKAILIHEKTDVMSSLESFINDTDRPSRQFTLHLKGTDFQIQVWKALLSIPEGQLKTYSEIARSIGKDNAHRAAGTAIGANNVAFLIPCHRVIRESGELGGYRWGLERKISILGHELKAINE